MSVISIIGAALTPLGIADPAVGEWPGTTTDNHITLMPIYDAVTEADDAELVCDEHIDVHIFYRGDFRPIKAAAKAALYAAGLDVSDYRYIECTDAQHHFVLTVIGRT